jgi:hypothetical protein
VAGEAHHDYAGSFQPVRHVQAADVQRAQPEALDERLYARLGCALSPAMNTSGGRPFSMT